MTKPESISQWLWLHNEFADMDLWHIVLTAATLAGVDDPFETAGKMYDIRGGKRNIPKKKKPLKMSPPKSNAEVAMLQNHPALASSRVCLTCLRKIGDSAYWVNPDAVVFHAGCMRVGA
jgi:hypothetical protein